MRLLCIAASDPYQHDAAQDLLDALLVAATFGAEVSVLFQDDGVWQLLKDQQGDRAARRGIGAQLESLPLFDVESLYADARSLHERGLTGSDLLLPVERLDTPALAALLAAHDQVIRL